MDRRAHPVAGPRRRDGSTLRNAVVWGAVAALFVVGVASATLFGSDGTSADVRAGPLQAWAAANGIAIGAAVDSEALENDPEYAASYARELSMVTPENVMKWRTIHPEPDRFDFTAAERLVAYAERHDMQVHGHTLVWHVDNSSWLTEGSFTRDELIEILRDHVTTVVRHFRGRVAEWDVVNEAIGDDGELRDTIWLRVIGPTYIDLAFRWAHEADPDAKLFYNDYGAEGAGVKSDGVYRLVRSMVRRGVPIDAVGLQMHTAIGEAPPRADVIANLRRITAVGLDAAITEMDVAVPMPSTSEGLEQQAETYREMVGACLGVPRCTGFATWGFTDRYSWVPTGKPGMGDALPLDAEFQAKPAYAAIQQAFDDSPRRRDPGNG